MPSVPGETESSLKQPTFTVAIEPSPSSVAAPATAVHTLSLLEISWPVMITLLVGISGPVLDSWFLSRISDDAAAGVGATLPVFVLLQTVLNSIAQAGSAIAGQYLGARKRRLAEATSALLVTFLVCGGLVLGSLLALASPYVAWGLGLRGTIADHAVSFLRIIGAGMVARALIAALTNLLASRGLTRWNLGVSVSIVALNVVFNLLLVGRLFGLPCLGVPGVAIATVLSWLVVGAGTFALVSRRLDFRLSRLLLALGIKRVLRTMVRISLPSAVEPVSYQLLMVALAGQIVRLGKLPLTARVYAGNLANFPVLFSYGLGFGAQILVSHLVGAKDFVTAHRRLKAAVAWGAGLSLLGGLVLATNARSLLGLFTRDAQVIALGTLLLWIDVLVHPAKATNIAVTFSLRAAGDSSFPAVVGPMLMWTVGLGSALGLAFGAGWGVIGIWIGMGIDEWSRAIANSLRWRSRAWHGKGVT
jgi:Na+-driven multidrug efflux pump